MRCLRSCMVATVSRRVMLRLPTSRSSSASGMTPTTSPPSAMTLCASAPISPTLPPPYTRRMPFFTRAEPSSHAASRYSGRAPVLEPQKTHRDRTGLPASAREPALELLEPVGAPERLAVDDHVRRAEHALAEAAVDFGAQPVLGFLRRD